MSHVETLEHLKRCFELDIDTLRKGSKSPYLIQAYENQVAALTAAIEALKLIEGAKRQYFVLGAGPRERRWDLGPYTKPYAESELRFYKREFPDCQFKLITRLTIDIEEPTT
jgi:hypothetical protein